MTRDEALFAQLPYTLREADFPELGQHYRGKVRDTYASGDKLFFITTDRLSAFDRVLTTVPFKGELLNRITVFWFEKTRDVAPNHLLDVPDPSVLVVKRLQPVACEMVVRGYLTGSLWRDQAAGRGARAYGVELPPDMRKDQAFDKPILTPSTKAAVGVHDEPISPAELVLRGVCSTHEWAEMADKALALFAHGQEWARSRGLILVDTKYEFGRDANGRLIVMDEIHTPDSSRYWIAEGSEARFAAGEDQQMLDKEFLRQWLIRERGYQGEGPLPEIPDEMRVKLASRYCELHERLLGQPPPLEPGEVRARIERALASKGYAPRG